MNANRYVDVELEELRNSVDPPPNVQEILNDLAEKIQNIHASFLFTTFGQKVLQKLCLCLCATKDSLIYSGWKDLAMALDFNPLIPQCIDNVNFNNQDPVSNMLVVYIQRKDATLINILNALHKLQRMDIILQLHPLVLEMCNTINQYFLNSDRKELLKPNIFPSPPFIYENLEDRKTFVKNIRRKEQNILQKSEDTSTSTAKAHRYDKVVMLTYNSVDTETAQEVATILRKERNGKRIGVVMLQNHVEKVNADPETFISNCFAQANYLIPILTTDYLNMLSNLQLTSSALDNIDNNYAKYIYTLMTNSYIRKGCRNKKIRGIIPDEVINDVQNHPFMNNSEFRVWVRLTEMEKFAERILASNI